MKKTLLSLGLAINSLLLLSQTFTSSGSFVVPASVTTITVQVIGAGGNGGGNGGGGGGGGGYAKGVYTVVPSSTIAVEVAAGGSGLISGIPSLSIIVTAGGNGASVSNPNLGGGGNGGVGTGGTISNFTGGTGGGGYWTYFGGGGGGAAGPLGNGLVGGNTIPWTGICQTPGGDGGLSGGAPAGNGGKGAGFSDPSCNVTDPAAVGLNFGGGGGGGNGNGGGAMNGAGGYVSITWDAITTSINADNRIDTYKVYPNPFVDKIIVSSVSEKATYELTNALGQMVWKGSQIQKHNFMDINNGVYSLKIISENTIKQIRLIKE